MAAAEEQLVRDAVAQEAAADEHAQRIAITSFNREAPQGRT